LRRLLGDLDLLVRQGVELVNELVDLPVGGVDLALEGGLGGGGFRRGEGPVACSGFQLDFWRNQGDTTGNPGNWRWIARAGRA